MFNGAYAVIQHKLRMQTFSFNMVQVEPTINFQRMKPHHFLKFSPDCHTKLVFCFACKQFKVFQSIKLLCKKWGYFHLPESLSNSYPHYYLKKSTQETLLSLLEKTVYKIMLKRLRGKHIMKSERWDPSRENLLFLLE